MEDVDATEGSTPDFEGLRAALLAAAATADPTERLLEVAAVIAEALSDLNLEPVVVGGLALAYWADSCDIITSDIDVVVPRAPELAERLARLGFEQHGREWLLPGFEVAFEAPDEVLQPGDKGEWAELASGRKVKILSIEDMLLWRLREWVFWHHASGFRHAAHLLVSEQLDSECLDRRAVEEGLDLAVAELRRLTGEVEAGHSFEEWELAEAGKRIEQQSFGGASPREGYSPRGDDPGFRR